MKTQWFIAYSSKNRREILCQTKAFIPERDQRLTRATRRVRDVFGEPITFKNRDGWRVLGNLKIRSGNALEFWNEIDAICGYYVYTTPQTTFVGPG